MVALHCANYYSNNLIMMALSRHAHLRPAVAHTCILRRTDENSAMAEATCRMASMFAVPAAT
jgi:hypothetical protein